MILSLQQFDTEGSFLREVQNCLSDAARCKILVIQTSFEDGVHSAQLIASAKYSAINEINKIQGNQGCILVYFITKLSRMESGASYVGFHGGLWQSVHIDDLCKSTVMVSDVTRLQDVTISQLFKPEGNSELETEHGAGDSLEEPMETEAAGSEEAPGVDLGTEGSTATGNAEQGGSHIMDTTSLLRSCIQSAVGTLRDQDGRQRSMRRVEILLGLLDEDDDDEVKAAFLRASKARLYVLLKQQEDQSLFNMKEWVTREASNQDALQEAGTFRYWAMGGVARCGSGTRAPRPWTARPRASSASSVRFRAVPVFPKGGRMVWVEVRWGLLDSGLLFCVCTFCRKNSAQLNKSRMCVPAGC